MKTVLSRKFETFSQFSDSKAPVPKLKKIRIKLPTVRPFFFHAHFLKMGGFFCTPILRPFCFYFLFPIYFLVFEIMGAFFFPPLSPHFCFAPHLPYKPINGWLMEPRVRFFGLNVSRVALCKPLLYTIYQASSRVGGIQE